MGQFLICLVSLRQNTCSPLPNWGVVYTPGFSPVSFPQVMERRSWVVVVVEDAELRLCSPSGVRQPVCRILAPVFSTMMCRAGEARGCSAVGTLI